MRRFLALVPALMAFAFATAELKSQTNQRPDNARETPKRVNVRKYFRIDHPKMAAKAMLEEARRIGADIDRRIYPESIPDSIGMFSQWVPVDESDDSFTREMMRLLEKGEVDSTVACLIQVRWHMSVRDHAELLQVGVTIYESIPGFALIARVLVPQLNEVLSLPQVRWVGAFKPAYKYHKNIDFPSGETQGDWLSVRSIAGDTEDCRRDLNNLGAKIHLVDRDTYYVIIEPEKVPALADLWWVARIATQPVPYQLD